ncbi:MAG: hypothetical protein JSS66_06830 [Armatimonadetes bacterium]|nr:hypothetical protein [Armatimonadota bacterium]
MGTNEGQTTGSSGEVNSVSAESVFMRAVLLNWGSVTVSTSASAVPGTTPSGRNSVVFCNCAPSGSSNEIYLGYGNDVTSTKHIARIRAGDSCEISAGDGVTIYAIANASSVAMGYAVMGATT